jgi:hypothetical protein
MITTASTTTGPDLNLSLVDLLLSLWEVHLILDQVVPSHHLHNSGFYLLPYPLQAQAVSFLPLRDLITLL